MNHDGNIRVLLENPKGSDFRWIAIVVLDDPPKKKKQFPSVLIMDSWEVEL